MKKSVLYSRVSTGKQDLQSQIDDLKHYAKYNDYEIVKSYGETVSGYDITAERIEYDNMKTYVIDNNIKNILCWELSRLGRNSNHTMNEIEFFTKNKINIFFKKENINTLSSEPTTKLLLTILSSMAELERNSFIERGIRGRDSAILKGKLLGSCPSYGYIKDIEGKWSINTIESKVIKLIFDMALQGDSLYKICQHLNSLKIPTRQTIQGKKTTLYSGEEVDAKWRPATIRRYLKKTIYKGIKDYKGNMVSIPIIVSPEIWDKVQKRFADNIGYINKNKHPYLFKGMIRCGRCNRIMSTQTRNHKVGYYLCSGMNDETHKCENQGYINTHMIDDNLYSILFNHTYIKEILSRDSLDAHSLKEKSGQIDYYYSEIISLKGTVERFKKLYTEGYMIFEEMTKEIGKVTNQIIDINNKISLLNNEIQVISKKDINDIIQTYKNATDYNMKREFVTKYINNVTLWLIDFANVDWKQPLHLNEKIIYVEMKSFNYIIPLKILLTPYSKNVIILKTLQYYPDYNMVVDSNKKG